MRLTPNLIATSDHYQLLLTTTIISPLQLLLIPALQITLVTLTLPLAPT